MEIKDKLEAAGIRTLGDLDAWIKVHPQRDKHGPFLMSRYNALRLIVGENAAIMMLNELAIQTCCKAASGHSGRVGAYRGPRINKRLASGLVSRFAGRIAVGSVECLQSGTHTLNGRQL